MFNFTLPRTLSKGELQLEKAKDYRNIVVMQILIVVFGLTLSEPIFEDSKSDISKLIITVFSFFGALYTYLMCDMLRNFTNNKILLAVIFFVLISAIGIGMLAEFPYYQIIHVPNRQALLLTVHGLLFPIEMTGLFLHMNSHMYESNMALCVPLYLLFHSLAVFHARMC